MTLQTLACKEKINGLVDILEEVSMMNLPVETKLTMTTMAAKRIDERIFMIAVRFNSYGSNGVH